MFWLPFWYHNLNNHEKQPETWEETWKQKSKKNAVHGLNQRFLLIKVVYISRIFWPRHDAGYSLLHLLHQLLIKTILHIHSDRLTLCKWFLNYGFSYWVKLGYVKVITKTNQDTHSLSMWPTNMWDFCTLECFYIIFAWDLGNKKKKV